MTATLLPNKVDLALSVGARIFLHVESTGSTTGPPLRYHLPHHRHHRWISQERLQQTQVCTILFTSHFFLSRSLSFFFIFTFSFSTCHSLSFSLPLSFFLSLCMYVCLKSDRILHLRSISFISVYKWRKRATYPKRPITITTETPPGTFLFKEYYDCSKRSSQRCGAKKIITHRAHMPPEVEIIGEHTCSSSQQSRSTLLQRTQSSSSSPPINPSVRETITNLHQTGSTVQQIVNVLFLSFVINFSHFTMDSYVLC